MGYRIPEEAESSTIWYEKAYLRKYKFRGFHLLYPPVGPFYDMPATYFIESEVKTRPSSDVEIDLEGYEKSNPGTGRKMWVAWDNVFCDPKVVEDVSNIPRGYRPIYVLRSVVSHV